jgi:hypothetical protein
MELKLLKFHIIVHIWEDILEYGVTLEYDTSANESMHKPSKKSSKMTQKVHKTFNFQTATHLVEFFLLDLAIEELDSNSRIWDYYDRKVRAKAKIPNENPAPTTGDAQIKVFEDDKTGQACFNICNKSKFVDKTTWNADVVEFLIGLQEKTQDFIEAGNLPIYTSHHRTGMVFRGHPNYHGKGPWRDWVWIDGGSAYGRPTFGVLLC